MSHTSPSAAPSSINLIKSDSYPVPSGTPAGPLGTVNLGEGCI